MITYTQPPPDSQLAHHLGLETGDIDEDVCLNGDSCVTNVISETAMYPAPTANGNSLGYGYQTPFT